VILRVSRGNCYSAGGHSTVPLYRVPKHENSHGMCLEDACYLYDKATVHGKRNSHLVYRSDSLSLTMHHALLFLGNNNTIWRH